MNIAVNVPKSLVTSAQPKFSNVLELVNNNSSPPETTPITISLLLSFRLFPSPLTITFFKLVRINLTPMP